MKRKYDYSVGLVYESNNYGPFEIIEIVGKDKWNHKRIKIRFINTGSECIVLDKNVISGEIMDPKFKVDFSIGSIHNSNNYGQFKIINDIGNDKWGHRLFEIEFIESGFKTIVVSGAIRSGKVRDDSMYNPTDYSIGSRHKSLNYGMFTIIEHLSKNNSHRDKFKIKFDYKGYELITTAECIRSGHVKNPYYPILCGVACIGVPKGSKEIYRKDYVKWKSMIYRCYNPKDSDYCNYGALGVTVCDRWLCFEYYLEDMPNIPGYNDYIKNPDIYQLDKDYLQLNIPINNRVYSPQTCMFIDNRLNSICRSVCENTRCGYHGVSPYGNNYCASISRNGHTFTIGVYETPELAGGAYNYYINNHHPNLIPNNVKTLSMQETSNLDLRSTKYNMCRIINNPNPYQLFPTLNPDSKPQLKEMCKIINK